MATIWSGWYWHLGLASFIAMSGAIAALSDCALAQVTPDVTLGAESSVVTPTNVNGIPSEQIDGGATRGANLFHSFDEFSVPNGSEAYFNNAASIQNIISRVTGGTISNIDGLLRANGTANLFLLNPNGIIFGSNATLNIGGSFMGSTASSLNFADGTSFSATAAQTTPLLTISVPIGLQYGGNPGSIRVQGDGQGTRSTTDLIDTTVGLRVEPNQTLALVGGDVALLGGTLKTAGGRIELGSVAGTGLVNLTPTHKGWTLGYSGVPTYPSGSPKGYGDIQLSQQAIVDASGEGGGDVQVRGRRVTLTNNSQIETSTTGSGPGGTLTVTASELVELTGSSAGGFATILGAIVYPGATGAGGNITLETGRLSVRDGAQIQTVTWGSGSAGTLTVNASDSVELVGSRTDDLASAAFTTSVLQGATGAGGNITLETGRLSVRDGAIIAASTLGTGSAGNLAVNALVSVEVIGETANGTPSLLTSETSGTGDAGDLRIETGQLTVRDRAQVNVSSAGTGAAGVIRVEAGSIVLDNSSSIQATTVAGNQGNIFLRSRDLMLRRDSNITTNARGTAEGGNITIDTDVLAALSNSDISANAQEASGGRVIIDAQGIFGTEFRERENPATSDITATSELGAEFNGTVEINTPDVDPSRELVTLPAEPVDASGLITQTCPGGGGQVASEFFVTGRGGLPENPSSTLSSDAVFVDLVTLNPKVENNSRPRQSPQRRFPPHGGGSTVSTNSTTPAPTQIVEANGWVKGPNGEVTLVATAPTANIDIPWLPSSSCNAPEPES